MFKPLGAKQSSRYCQKLSRILLPPVSLSIIGPAEQNHHPWNRPGQFGCGKETRDKGRRQRCRGSTRGSTRSIRRWEWPIGWTICQWECGESITEGTFGGRRKSSFERPEVFTHSHWHRQSKVKRGFGGLQAKNAIEVALQKQWRGLCTRWER